MHLLYRRYARSGYASPWFHAVAAVAFAALAVFALVRHDWLVAGIAAAMIAATAAGSRVMRRLGNAAEESRRRVAAMEDQHGD
jgi:membrane protein implicated in regulation of membrane protease activity